MFVMIFESRKDDFFSWPWKIGLDEEIRVEGAQVKIVVLRRQRLLQQLMSVVIPIEVGQHLGLSNFG